MAMPFDGMGTYKINLKGGGCKMPKAQVIKATVEQKIQNGVKHITRLRVAAYCRVSTDKEMQVDSYDAQVKHYEDYIKSNPDWEFIGIYADEGITATQTKKRYDFNRLVNDCMNGKIDKEVERKKCCDLF